MSYYYEKFDSIYNVSLPYIGSNNQWEKLDYYIGFEDISTGNIVDNINIVDGLKPEFENTASWCDISINKNDSISYSISIKYKENTSELRNLLLKLKEYIDGDFYINLILEGIENYKVYKFKMNLTGFGIATYNPMDIEGSFINHVTVYTDTMENNKLSVNTEKLHVKTCEYISDDYTISTRYDMCILYWNNKLNFPSSSTIAITNNTTYTLRYMYVGDFVYIFNFKNVLCGTTSSYTSYTGNINISYSFDNDSPLIIDSNLLFKSGSNDAENMNFIFNIDESWLYTGDRYINNNSMIYEYVYITMYFPTLENNGDFENAFGYIKSSDDGPLVTVDPKNAILQYKLPRTNENIYKISIPTYVIDLCADFDLYCHVSTNQHDYNIIY